MPWPSDMDGYPPIYFYIASVRPLSLLSIFCPVQGGGLPNVRHSEICDVTVSLLTEVCYDVSLELELQPCTHQ